MSDPEHEHLEKDTSPEATAEAGLTGTEEEAEES